MLRPNAFPPSGTMPPLRTLGEAKGMEGHSELECNVHELLNEANVLLLQRAPKVAKARHLIQFMLACADKAKAAGADYAEAERRLRQAAEALELKVGGAGPPNSAPFA